MNGHKLTSTWVAVALAAVAVPVVPAAAGEDEDTAVIRTLTAGGPGFTGDLETIEVRVENNDIMVIVNGEEIPKDRIRREGGQVIILDEDGKELRSVGIFVGEDDPIWWFGNDEQDFRRWRSFVERWNDPAESAEAPRVMLGVYLTEPSEALRYHLGLDEDAGVLIASVAEGVAAHAAGLRRHDIVIELDGQQPVTRSLITEALADRDPGDRIRMTVIQAGERRTLNVTLDEYDPKRLLGLSIGRGVDINVAFGAPDIQRRLKRFGPDSGEWRFDSNGRVFEWPKISVDVDTDSDEQVDRIDRLNQRIEELQQALERLLEETGDNN